MGYQVQARTASHPPTSPFTPCHCVCVPAGQCGALQPILRAADPPRVLPTYLALHTDEFQLCPGRGVMGRVMMGHVVVGRGWVLHTCVAATRTCRWWSCGAYHHEGGLGFGFGNFP